MPGDSYAGSVNVPFGVETPCSTCPLSSGRLWGVGGYKTPTGFFTW